MTVVEPKPGGVVSVEAKPAVEDGAGREGFGAVEHQLARRWPVRGFVEVGAAGLVHRYGVGGEDLDEVVRVGVVGAHVAFDLGSVECRSQGGGGDVRW